MSAYPARAPEAEKYLSDNRERYIAQSKQTKGGVVAKLPKRSYAQSQCPLTAEEEVEGWAHKYGVTA